MTSKKIPVLLLIVILFFSIPLTVSADNFTPYLGYEINDYDESVATPVGHTFVARYDNISLGLDIKLNEAQDLFFHNDILYILDSGNGRIICTNEEFNKTTVISNFVDKDGNTYNITGANGFTVSYDGSIYIADTSNLRILKYKDGLVTQVIERPESAMINSDTPFKVTKILVDSDNRIYAIAESVNLGAFVFNQEGEFLNFFGSNSIVKTAEVIANYFKKQFLTAEQRAGLKSITPVAFTNFDIDKKGFIYTVTSDGSADATNGIVRWLNYKGTDILDTEKLSFGDVERSDTYWSDFVHTQFSDIDIDDEGFINIIDKGRGKIFQYSMDGKSVSIFGGYGKQQGTFTSPIAIESIKDKIYVLDSEKNAVFVFEPTHYGSTLRAAISKTDENDPEAMVLWKELLKSSTNSKYPYFGIGSVYDSQGEYKLAMDNFKLAGANEEYSKAFREYREIAIRENIVWFLLGLVLIIAVIVIISKLLGKRFVAVDGTAYSPLETKYGLPLYVMRHPVDGFEQLRLRKIYFLPAVVILIISWFLIKTLVFYYTGFSFNSNRPEDYNFLTTFISTIGFFVLFVVANWAVCTLFNGKGTVKEIITVCAYSLLPMLLSKILNVILSNVLTLEEATFLTIISAIGIGWSLFVLIAGLYAVHQYSFGGTIGSILATLVGMFVIGFLLIMFYSLIQQTVSFAQSLVEELSMR